MTAQRVRELERGELMIPMSTHTLRRSFLDGRFDSLLEEQIYYQHHCSCERGPWHVRTISLSLCLLPPPSHPDQNRGVTLDSEPEGVEFVEENVRGKPRENLYL